MDYYIGIDIGTTSTKAVAFSLTGEVLAQKSLGYPILHPQQDRSEQQPEEILEAVIYCLQQIIVQLPLLNPVLVSFSSAMHSLILIDNEDKPLTNSLIWADNRAAEIAGNLKETSYADDFYTSSGVPIHAMSPFCKLCWFKEHDPLLFSSAKKFIGIKEFIFQRLFDTYIVDTAIASATGLLNTKLLQWDEHILQFTGINKNQLSTIVPTTHIEYLKEKMHNNLGLRLQAFSKTAFVIGSSDGGLANLGTGATSDEILSVTIGTSSAARVVTQQPITDAMMRTFCYHLSGNQYIMGGASNNGAVVLQWIKENILQNKEPYDKFLSMAEGIDAGCNGLVFLPYILGERAPLWNSAARGVYFGLHISHTTAHMVRAAMEAVVYNIYAIGKILIEKNNIKIIYANGGFSDSIFWVQLLSDVFNLPVYVPEMEESSTLGAVMVGMNALGIPFNFNFTQGKNYQPNLLNYKIYTLQAAKMDRIYELVKSEF